MSRLQTNVTASAAQSFIFLNTHTYAEATQKNPSPLAHGGQRLRVEQLLSFTLDMAKCDFEILINDPLTDGDSDDKRSTAKSQLEMLEK